MSKYVTLEHSFHYELSRNNILLVTADIIDFMDNEPPEITIEGVSLNGEELDVYDFSRGLISAWKQLAFEWWVSQ